MCLTPMNRVTEKLHMLYVPYIFTYHTPSTSSSGVCACCMYHTFLHTIHRSLDVQRVDVSCMYHTFLHTIHLITVQSQSRICCMYHTFLHTIHHIQHNLLIHKKYGYLPSEKFLSIRQYSLPEYDVFYFSTSSLIQAILHLYPIFSFSP